jgi:hypothetical protein
MKKNTGENKKAENSKEISLSFPPSSFKII